VPLVEIRRSGAGAGPGRVLVDAAVAEFAERYEGGQDPPSTLLREGARRAQAAPATADGEAVGIGASVVLLAVGAILTFALEVSTEGIDLDTVGVILMIAGGLGLLISLLFWSSVAPFGSRTAERTVVREERF
jgi:hypothetical protein